MARIGPHIFTLPLGQFGRRMDFYSMLLGLLITRRKINEQGSD